MILFGFYAKGAASKNSDVDLAVVSSSFGKAPLLEKMKLYELRYDAGIDIDLQPVPFGKEDFLDEDNFFAVEI